MLIEDRVFWDILQFRLWNIFNRFFFFDKIIRITIITIKLIIYFEIMKTEKNIFWTAFLGVL